MSSFRSYETSKISDQSKSPRVIIIYFGIVKMYVLLFSTYDINSSRFEQRVPQHVS